MKILLATLCLNEMEWLPALYRQHRSWPGMVGWAFVEAADVEYARTNPGRVRGGLSADNTTEFLTELHRDDRRIQYIPHGLTSHPTDPAQGKSQARNRYLALADSLRPDWVVVLDADEFYPVDAQHALTDLLLRTEHRLSVRVRQRHVWKPPFYNWPADPFSQEVVGGYWDVPHTRIWRYVPGMRYVVNHNWPSDGTGRMDRNVLKTDKISGLMNHIQCVHTGYAGTGEGRTAKHRYYVARGEGNEAGRMGRLRRMYVDCRRAWEEWTPGTELPHGARVIPYTGPIPEAFK